jgi:arylsulfatase A-like enzyme
MRPIPLTLLALACVLGCPSCGEPGGEPASAPSPEPPRVSWKPPAPVNVVLIVIDTLRADAVLDPAGRYDTPSLDRLGRNGVVFPRAFAAAPMTLPSHVSLFSSRPPLETKVFNNGVNVPEDLPLLASWLSQHGYHSRAVVSLGTLNPLHPTQSPARGFAAYDCDYWDIALAANTKERLSESLAQRDAAKPLFLFAHFSDPHEPYDSHGTESNEVELLMDGEVLGELVTSDTNQWSQEVELTDGRTVFEFQIPRGEGGRFRVRRFECRENGQSLPVTWEQGQTMERVARARVAVDRGENPAARCELKVWVNDVPSDDDARRRRYALEVAYVDRYVGELLDELERLGLYQDSLVVFTSDHGEAMGEHHFFGHVESLTDEQIHVPLIVKLPRADPRTAELARAAEKLVTQLDLVPTMLEAIGLPGLPGQRGTALFAPHDSVHLAQTSRPEAKKDQIALRDERFKLIYFPEEERFAMYDLAADPGELVDVFPERTGERPSWPEQLHQLYQQSLVRAGTENEDGGAEREAMLKALGYGGGEE